MTDQKPSFVQTVRRYLPPSVLILIAIAVVVGVGLLLFALASGTGAPSTAPTTSVVMLFPGLAG